MENFESIKFQVQFNTQRHLNAHVKLSEVIKKVRVDANAHSIAIKPWVVLKRVLSVQLSLLHRAKRGDQVALMALNSSLTKNPSTLTFDIESDASIAFAVNELFAIANGDAAPITLHLTEECDWLHMQLRITSFDSFANGVVRWRKDNPVARPKLIGDLLSLWENEGFIKRYVMEK